MLSTIPWILGNLIPTKYGAKTISRMRKKKQDKEKLKIIEQNLPGKELAYSEFSNSLSKKEFLTALRKRDPFVIRGAANNWKAVQNWTPKYLKENFPHVIIPLADPIPNSKNKYEEVPMSEGIDRILAGESKYCKFADTLYKAPELTEQLGFDFFKRLLPLFSTLGVRQFFLGPKSSETILHCALGHNFFTQIYGKKHWIIYPTKYNALFMPVINKTPHFIACEEFHFPHKHESLGKRLDHWKITLNPGDVLFNPSYLWHTVSNSSNTIAVKYSWISKESFFNSPALFIATLLSYGKGIFTLKKNLNSGKAYPEKLDV